MVPEKHFPVTVGVVADLGEDCNHPGCGNSTITAITSEAKANNFSLLIHAGDIAYTSGVQTVWDEFLREMEHVRRDELSTYMIICYMKIIIYFRHDSICQYIYFFLLGMMRMFYRKYVFPLLIFACRQLRVFHTMYALATMNIIM